MIIVVALVTAREGDELAMLQTRLTELLNVRYPIMLAGMAGVSLAEVVAAVSEAGGYGVLGAGDLNPDQISEEMARVRKLTNKPFGVDLLHALNDNPIEEVRRIIDGGATSFAAGLGVPSRVIGLCHEAGLKVITVTATVKHAADGGRGWLRLDRRPRLGSRRTHGLGRLLRPVPASRRCCLDPRRRRRRHL